MASEPNRQSSFMGGDFALGSGATMDQATVESLLRRLLQRVEDSEQRYSQALDDLHARLDQLSQSTGQPSPSATPEQAETLARLHSQVSDLAKTFDSSTRTATEADEFAELGKTLSAAAGLGATPRPLALESAPEKAFPDFNYAAPVGQMPLMPMLEQDEAELDKRLIAMAHRLEHSIETAMPATALEALNAKMDEIASRFEAALNETVKRDNLETLERQISDMGQQLNRAEQDLAKINGIETQLNRIIARFEEAPSQIEQAAIRAAAESFRLSGGETKSSAAERLEAIHRDIVAMNERGQATDDRLADTMEAVHKSLQQLVQQVEKGTRPVPAMAPQTMPAPPPQPERKVAEASPTEAKVEKAESAAETAGKPVLRKENSLRSRLGAALPDFQKREPKLAPKDLAKEHAMTKEPEATARAEVQDAEFDAGDDFVAAAQRAAQAAAAKAEERNNGKSRKAGRASASNIVAPLEPEGRRKRPLLIILAAVLLMISAALFYGRLKSKPEAQPQATPPAAEQSTPAPAAPVPPGAPAGGTVAPERSGKSDVPPAKAKPHGTQPPSTGELDIAPPVTVGDVEVEMPEDAATAADAAVAAPERVLAPNPEPATTEIAKTVPVRTGTADPEIAPVVQPASLTTNDGTALPPGVTVTIVEPQDVPALPKDGTQAVRMPMPPEGVGAVSLRQAATNGDPKAQYAIGNRYAQGEGVARDAVQAVTWFELAANGGLAPAQYRLGVLYERGEGVAKDHAKARDWYARAAEKGNVKAMHNLAVAVSGSKDEKPNYAMAARWFAEAAKRGLADSQFNLGILTEHGLGARKNLMEAYKWFALAARSGDAEAIKRRDLVKLQMPAEAVAITDKTVASWRPASVNAEANDVTEQPTWHEAAATSPNRELVSRTQGLLNKLGYDVGAPDGELGDRTRDAIRKFQQRNGLDETGEVSVPLVTKLERLTS
jgi:localization factor PodJL